MGYFLAVTAIKSDDIEEILLASENYMKSFDLSADLISNLEDIDWIRDAQIYKPVDGWTVILWPEYFNIHDFPFIRSVSAKNEWLLSTVHVYDGDYWEHLACSSDFELHIFCSWPNYWKNDAPEDFKKILGYNNEPSRLAEALSIDPATIEPYIISVDTLEDENAKAYQTDEFVLSNFWVFTDFWKKLGIVYPNPPDGLQSLLRLGEDFMDKLPAA